MENDSSYKAELNHLISEAYLNGMSVIEIAFVLNSGSVGYIHDIIRKTGYIENTDTQTSRSAKIDPYLKATLAAKKYSFGRWCNGWMLNVEQVQLELAERRAGKIKQAIRRDFPKYYERVFNEPAEPLFGRDDSFSFGHPSINIAFDRVNNFYKGTYLEEPDLFTIYAAKISEVALRFEAVYGVKIRIQVLGKAIAKYKAQLKKIEES